MLPRDMPLAVCCRFYAAIYAIRHAFIRRLRHYYARGATLPPMPQRLLIAFFDA